MPWRTTSSRSMVHVATPKLTALTWKPEAELAEADAVEERPQLSPQPEAISRRRSMICGYCVTESGRADARVDRAMPMTGGGGRIDHVSAAPCRIRAPTRPERFRWSPESKSSVRCGYASGRLGLGALLGLRRHVAIRDSPLHVAHTLHRLRAMLREPALAPVGEYWTRASIESWRWRRPAAADASTSS